LAAELERHLLQVEDDIGRVFNHSGDGLKLVQHAFDFDRGDGRALDRGEQHAPQRIADGGAEAAFEGLRPDAAVLVAERLGVYREALGFLKTFPKNHDCLLRPCCSRPAGKGVSSYASTGPAPERRRIWLESVGPKISFKFRVSSLEMRPFNARYRTGLQLIIPSLGLE